MFFISFPADASRSRSLSLTFAYAKNGMTVDSYGTIDYYYFFTDTYGCLRLLTRKTETETLFTIILRENNGWWVPPTASTIFSG